MINKRLRDASLSEVQIQKRKRVYNEHQHIDISCFSNDILHSIFSFFITTSGFIDGPTLRSIALVSKKWKKVVDSPSLWSIPIMSPGTKNQASINFSLGLQEVSGRSSFMGFTKLAKYGSKPGSDATVFSAKEKATGKNLILSISGSEQKACEIINEAYQGHVALQTGFLENLCSEDDSPDDKVHSSLSKSSFPRGIQILNERVVRWYNPEAQIESLITKRLALPENKDLQKSISRLFDLQRSFGTQDTSRRHLETASWASIVDWVIEVVDVFELDDKTAHIAMGLVDRVIATSELAIKKENYQLLSGACLWIAAKCCNRPISGLDISLCADNLFSEMDLLRVEEFVLKKLEWKLAFPTSFDFVGAFCNDLGLKKDSETLQMIQYISDLTLQSSIYLAFEPSIIASCCMVLGRFTVQENDLWPEKLSKQTGYSLDDLSECIMEMSRMLEHIRWWFPDLIMISRRYRTKSRKYVSLTSIPSIATFATLSAYQESQSNN